MQAATESAMPPAAPDETKHGFVSRQLGDPLPGLALHLPDVGEGGRRLGHRRHHLGGISEPPSAVSVADALMTGRKPSRA
jgi:hypothetical protein